MAQRVASEVVAMETCGLVAAKAVDQFPTSFRVFISFSDDKMSGPSGINTHHTRWTCKDDAIVGGIR